MLFVRQSSQSVPLSSDLTEIYGEMSVIMKEAERALQKSELAISKIHTLNSKIYNSLTYKSYSCTASSNEYVAPYKYYLNQNIPSDDITNIGTPISIHAQGTAGVPIPCGLHAGNNSGEYYFVCASMSSSIEVTIVFLDVFHVL